MVDSSNGAEIAGQTTLSSPVIGGRGPCVIVDIAGDRAGHLECATGDLAATAQATRRLNESARAIADKAAPAGDVARGVANTAATRLRQQSHEGQGVPFPANPLGRRP